MLAKSLIECWLLRPNEKELKLVSTSFYSIIIAFEVRECTLFQSCFALLPAGYRVILKKFGSYVRPISSRFREVAAVIRLAGS